MSTWFAFAFAAPVSVLALFYVGRDIFWLFRPQSSPGMRGLANGWDEGYEQSIQDSDNWQNHAGNPYREPGS